MVVVGIGDEGHPVAEPRLAWAINFFGAEQFALAEHSVVNLAVSIVQGRFAVRLDLELSFDLRVSGAEHLEVAEPLPVLPDTSRLVAVGLLVAAVAVVVVFLVVFEPLFGPVGRTAPHVMV